MHVIYMAVPFNLLLIFSMFEEVFLVSYLLLLVLFV